MADGPISSRNALTATGVTDPPDIRIGIDNLQGATPASNQMSLPELGKAIGSVINKDTVAEMLALTGVPDGTRVDTARYSTSHAVGDGSGGEYVYDADSEATIDGGFVLPGIGGSLSFSGTTFNGTAGTGRWLLKDTTVANAKQFGAIGNDSNDDTSALQRTFKHPHVYIPRGFYRVSSTITINPFPLWRSMRIRGDGAPVSDVRTGNVALDKFAGSLICWNGAAGGTLFEVKNLLGIHCTDLSLAGKVSNSAGDRAGTLMQWNQVIGGSGESSFAMCTFRDADKGMVFASVIGEGTNAGVNFAKTVWEDFDTAVEVNNSQGLNYNFWHLSTDRCDRVIHCVNGGNVHVETANLRNSGDGDNYCFDFEAIGTNIFSNHLNHVRVETNETKRLVRAVGLGSVVLDSFTDARSQNTVTTPMFYTAGCEIVVRDSNLKSYSTSTPTFEIRIHTGSQKGSVRCERVYFDQSTFDPAAWFSIPVTTHQVEVSVVDCYYGGTLTRIPSFANRPHTYPFRGEAQTVGAVAAGCTFAGETRGFSTVMRLPDDATSAYQITVTGIDDLGGRHIFNYLAEVSHINGTTTLLGYSQVSKNATLGSVLPYISDGYDSLEVQVTGATGRTINWTTIIQPAGGSAKPPVYSKDTVAEMLTLTGVPDGTAVHTARYSTSHVVGDGSGGEYVYDADSTATIDGGFVMPGIGGSLSFSGTTFNGTAGTGRWLLKDTTVANARVFGALVDATTNDANAIMRALASGSEIVVDGVAGVATSITVPANTQLRFIGIGKLKALADVSVLSSSADDISIHNLTIDLNSTSVEAVTLSSCANVRLLGTTTITNAATDGVAASGGIITAGCTNLRIDHLVASGIRQFSASTGLYRVVDLATATDAYIGRIEADDCDIVANVFSSSDVMIGSITANDITDNAMYVVGTSEKIHVGSIKAVNCGEGVVLDSSVADAKVTIGDVFVSGATAYGLVWRDGGGYFVSGLHLVESLLATSSNSESVAADSVADTLTATGHGFANGDRVRFDTTGTAPGGLSNYGIYYVVGAAANSLQLSATSGGAAIDITSAGSGSHSLVAIGNRDGLTIGNLRALYTGSGSRPIVTEACTRLTIQSCDVYVDSPLGGYAGLFTDCEYLTIGQSSISGVGASATNEGFRFAAKSNVAPTIDVHLTTHRVTTPYTLNATITGRTNIDLVANSEKYGGANVFTHPTAATLELRSANVSALTGSLGTFSVYGSDSNSPGTKFKIDTLQIGNAGASLTRLHNDAGTIVGLIPEASVNAGMTIVLPTSATGLPSGAIWNNSGTITVVP